jgi:hypothetical protein
VLRLQLSTPHVPPLGKGYINWLPGNNLSIHLVHGPSGILGRREANESESTADPRILIPHDTRTGNGTHARELIPEHIVGNGIVQILDVQVHALEFGNAIHLLALVLGPQLAFALGLLLRASHVQGLLDFFTGILIDDGEFLVVHFLNGCRGGLVGGKVDESKA